MPRVVPLRGVIEGFYGAPWSADARHALFDRLGPAGMNAYVYAPKDEPKHRAAWRGPYDGPELAAFRALAGAGAAVGIRVGFAISPGLDVDYRAPADRAALHAKLAPLADAGIDWFVLALDDIPLRPGLASEQADLVQALVDDLGGARLTLCPTEYVGTRPTEYLATLAAELPPAVQVMWTGPTVCSPTIRAADADAWAAALGDRRPVLWDNFPVNDATMTSSLHLGPYEGREPALTDRVDGVLLNPMTQAHASAVALLTAAEFLADPVGYDPDAAWGRAVAAVGGEHATAFAPLARACSTSPLRPPARLPLRRDVDGLGTATPDDPTGRRAALAAELLAAKHAGRDWPPGDPLGDEVRPWLDALAVEARAGLAALRLVDEVRGEAPDAERLMHLGFRLLFEWSAARTTDRVVYGPRFAIYAAVVQLADGRPGLDVDATLVEDGSAIDRLCRWALGEYRAWTGAVGAG
jgi:hyaluronoglucosaminidase